MCSLRALGRRAFFILTVLAVSGVASTAAADVYKCVAKDGSPKYQNFPCPIDSLGLPSLGVQAAPASGAVSQKPKSDSASNIKPSARNELHIGMTAEEVIALLGDPQDVEEDEPAHGRVSTWRYADGPVLQFDYKRRVSEIRR